MNSAHVDAREALRYIREGVSDLDIMSRFSLSAVGLISMFDQLIEAGILDQETLDQRMQRYHQTVALSRTEVPVWETAVCEEHAKPKIRLDAKQVLADITYGCGDSELMEKYGLSVRGLQSLFTKLINARLITQDELDNRKHWSQRNVQLETYECPMCFKPQFFQFDECPQCGVIMSKLPPEVRNRPKPEAAHWTVEMGNIKCQLRTNGRSMVVTGLNVETSREIAQKLKSLFSRLQEQLDRRESGTDSRFWVQQPGRAESGRIKAEQNEREWVIEVGRFTITRSVDGEKLVIEGLKESFQREVLSTLQLWVAAQSTARSEE